MCDSGGDLNKVKKIIEELLAEIKSSSDDEDNVNREATDQARSVFLR